MPHFPPQPSDLPEADRFPGAPHPREMLLLLGHEAVEAQIRGEITANRLHHALLISGPEGIGKATLAYRLARFLLAQDEGTAQDKGTAPGLDSGRAPETLAVGAQARAAHLIAHNAHPDLAVLTRRADAKTKKLRGEISVEDTRNALDLFAKTAAFGGWRILIVDCADDLNKASANALLKTLEEPPQRALFLLVAHQPQKLLPTIRSRCRQITLEPLSRPHVAQITQALATPLSDAQLAAAQGSVRHALRLADKTFAAFSARLAQILEALPAREGAIAFAETIRNGAEGEQPFADFNEALGQFLHQKALAAARSGALYTAQALVRFAQTRRAEAGEVEAYNLDRRAFVLATLNALAQLLQAA